MKAIIGPQGVATRVQEPPTIVRPALSLEELFDHAFRIRMARCAALECEMPPPIDYEFMATAETPPVVGVRAEEDNLGGPIIPTRPYLRDCPLCNNPPMFHAGHALCATAGCDAYNVSYRPPEWNRLVEGINPDTAPTPMPPPQPTITFGDTPF